MNKLTLTLLLMAALVPLNAAHAETPKAEAPQADAPATAPAEAKPAKESDAKQKAKPEGTAKRADKAEKSSAKSGKEAKPKKGAKATPYPLKTCIVTDNKLGSMGDPLTMVHEGQEVKVCCKPCVAKFNEDPATYLEKLKKDSKG